MQDVNQAMEVAGRYHAFQLEFPMWHRDQKSANVAQGGTIQFLESTASLNRRVSAFQKGFTRSPGGGGSARSADGVTMDAVQSSIRDAALLRCAVIAPRTMGYPEPRELHRSLYPTYLARLASTFRRPDTVLLGAYTMGEFRRAYSALITVVAAHSDLCYWFGRMHGYPQNSAVMVRSSNEWVRLLSSICDLPDNTVGAIIADLTLRDRFWDMHVHPIVRLDEDNLAIAPPFPLHARADDNVLRVVNHRRRTFFDMAALQKEEEMLGDLLQRIPAGLNPRTRIALPAPLPDIDFLLEDRVAGTLFVAELKWLQKPVHWKERLEREGDFRKGLGQLARIRDFLAKSPAYLAGKGITSRRLDACRRALFALVARDFFIPPESGDLTVVDHEVFKEAAATASDLEDLINRVESYDWLPVEGTHFRVQRERLSLGGAAIEIDVYYRY